MCFPVLFVKLRRTDETMGLERGCLRHVRMVVRIEVSEKIKRTFI